MSDELVAMLREARADRVRASSGQLVTPHVDDMSDKDMRTQMLRSTLNENWHENLLSFREDYDDDPEVEERWREGPETGSHDAYRWKAGMPTIYDARSR